MQRLGKKEWRQKRGVKATVFGTSKQAIMAEACQQMYVNKEDYSLVFYNGIEVPDNFSLAKYLQEITYISKFPSKKNGHS